MREFDDIIRRKLEQLPVEGTPDWKALESQLEGDAFDALVRGQLASNTSLSGADKVAPAIVGWDALSTKLDVAAEVESNDFDRIIAQKLSNTQVGLEPQASWKVLSRRMDTLWPLRKVLVRYRVLEIAAAIALLLTFAPLLRDNPVSFTAHSSGATDATAISSLATAENNDRIDAGSTAPFLQPAEIAELIYTTDLQHQQSADGIREAQVATSKNEGGNTSLYSPFALLKEAFSWFASSDTPNSGSFAPGTPALLMQKSALTSEWSPKPLGESPIAKDFKRAQVNTALTAIDEFSLAPIDAPKGPTPLLAVPSAKVAKWTVGPQAGYLAWNIRTPVDMEFEQQANSRWRGEGMLGITATRQLGKRTALGLGASFARLTYDPELPVVFDAADQNGSLSPSRIERFDRTESFDGITVNLAQVPVDLRVQLNSPEKRFNLVAFAGAAANFNLSSNYDLKPVFGTPNIVSGPSSELEEVIENEFTFTDVKSFEPGLLEKGGTLAGNTFLTARVGLESSVELTDRISAFSSLSYNHFLPLDGGFGPNNDKLNAVGLTLGARVSL